MTKVRSLLVTLGLVFGLTLGAVSAQDPCFGLAQADCDVINQANTNTFATVQSFYQNWSIEFSVTGLPDTTLTFNAQGEGPVVFDMMGAFPLVTDQKISVQANDGLQPIDAQLGLVVVDGKLYVSDGSQWMGIDLVAAAQNPQALGLPDNITGLLGGDAGSAMEDPTTAALMGQADTLMPLLMDLGGTPGLAKYERSGDNFTFTLDLLPALRNPSFGQVMQALGTSSPDVAQVAQLAQLLPMLLQNGVITTVQKLDAANNLVTGLVFTTDLSVNGQMISSQLTAPIVVKLVFTVDISNPNGTFDVVAPEGAQMMPMPGSN